MVSIHFGCMTGHCFCHTPDIFTTCTQKVIPQPHIRSKFRIIPGKSADVITPRMTDGVISMHYISIIPESIPLVLLYGLTIKIDICIQAIFYPGTERSTPIRKTPYTKSLLRMKIIRRRQQYPELRKRFSSIGKSLFSNITSLWNKCQRSSTGDTIGSTHSVLNIFVTGI